MQQTCCPGVPARRLVHGAVVFIFNALDSFFLGMSVNPSVSSTNESVHESKSDIHTHVSSARNIHIHACRQGRMVGVCSMLRCGHPESCISKQMETHPNDRHSCVEYNRVRIRSTQHSGRVYSNFSDYAHFGLATVDNLDGTFQHHDICIHFKSRQILSTPTYTRQRSTWHLLLQSIQNTIVDLTVHIVDG